MDPAVVLSIANAVGWVLGAAYVVYRDHKKPPAAATPTQSVEVHLPPPGAGSSPSLPAPVPPSAASLLQAQVDELRAGNESLGRSLGAQGRLLTAMRHDFEQHKRDVDQRDQEHDAADVEFRLDMGEKVAAIGRKIREQKRGSP